MRKLTTSVPGIYVITCLPTGKVYVGQAKNCTQRWGGHRWHLNKGTHRNYHLQRAWRLHGQSAFTFEIAAEPIGDEVPALAWLEAEILSYYRHSYNLMEAGEERLTASPETRAKLSADRLKRWADPEYRERVKASHAARNADPEYRARHAAAMKAFNSTPEGFAVRSKIANDTWAKEGARERRSEKTKAHWDDPEHRAKQEASRKAAWQDGEVREKRARGIKGAWDSATPEERAARIAAATAKQRTPEGRAAQAERGRIAWIARKAKKAAKVS